MKQLKTEFSMYVEDRRQTPIEGFECCCLPHLTRYIPKIVGMEGYVVFGNFPEGEEIKLIREEINFFQKNGIDFEWKIYDFDEPNNLRELLEDEGLVCGERDSEAFMIFDTRRDQVKRNSNPRAIVERVRSVQGIRDIALVQQIVWDQDFSWLVQQLSDVLAHRPEELSLYCAYVDGEPIASGWTSFPANSLFPELHGGAVVPAWRSKGIYGDIYHVRCGEISDRGYTWTSVDATEMSRPILERLGFNFVCMTHPMKYSPN
jgi:hypothetical protein